MRSFKCRYKGLLISISVIVSSELKRLLTLRPASWFSANSSFKPSDIKIYNYNEWRQWNISNSSILTARMTEISDPTLETRLNLASDKNDVTGMRHRSNALPSRTVRNNPFIFFFRQIHVLYFHIAAQNKAESLDLQIKFANSLLSYICLLRRYVCPV